MSNFFTHRRVRRLLYEYVRKELSSGQMDMVEAHLRHCPGCSAEADEIRSAIQIIPSRGFDPASEQPPEFWKAFAENVREQMGAPKRHKVPTFREEWDVLLSLLVARQRWVVGLSGAVAVIVATLILYTPVRNPVQPPAPLSVQTNTPQATQPQADYMQVKTRMGDYFRKSRTLLVGISNMKVQRDQPLDLSVEQQLSRQLVHEAGYLKQQPLDVRSAKVVSDVERVLIELANIQKDHRPPNVELIRSGIHQENLLFKIRMAETMYDSVYTGGGSFSRRK